MAPDLFEVARNTVIVTATRVDEATFFHSTLLGRSLLHLPALIRPRLIMRDKNVGERREGLPEVYNRAIDNAEPADTLIFVHDDVYLHDWYTPLRVAEALERFDIVGLAGAANSAPEEPNWGLAFSPEMQCMGWQKDLMASGAVAHGYVDSEEDCCHEDRLQLSIYGVSPLPCMSLDGLFLVARVSTLHSIGVRFDERFPFHCYDRAFCRLAIQKGLRLGTWPIAVTHASEGAFASPEYRQAGALYRKVFP